jgi:anti-sigma regulatory factor (Ser/Thr protein kinase)
MTLVTTTPNIRLNILSDPANLAGVRQAVEGLCAANGFDPKATGEVGLCVNEAVANVIRHAYDGATDRPIEVSADVLNGEVRVQVRDWGKGVNPETLPQGVHDPLKPGGLGLICLCEMMDRVLFTPQPDGMLLHMARRRDRGEPKAANR